MTTSQVKNNNSMINSRFVIFLKNKEVNSSIGNELDLLKKSNINYIFLNLNTSEST